MTPASQAASALRATASAFDAQRGKLPILSHPHRSPEPVAVARQITELSTLVTDLSNRILRPTAETPTGPDSARATTAYAAALELTGRAIAALGAISHQLAFLDQTWPYRSRPEVREAHETIPAVIEDALAEADAALQDAANVLHATATSLAQPSPRLQAALSRSALAAAEPSPAAAAAPSPANSTARTPARSR